MGQYRVLTFQCTILWIYFLQKKAHLVNGNKKVFLKFLLQKSEVSYLNCKPEKIATVAMYPFF